MRLLNVPWQVGSIHRAASKGKPEPQPAEMQESAWFQAGAESSSADVSATKSLGSLREHWQPSQGGLVEEGKRGPLQVG